MKTEFQIPFDNKYKINCSFYSINTVIKPLIIFVHGFKGFKDWGGFPYFLDKLSSEGYAVLSFNFTLNGFNEKPPMFFSRLDLFAENTFSRELLELNTVINYLYGNAEKFKIDKNRIAVIGHSRGGGISILQSAGDSRIKCLAALSSVSVFDRYSDKLKQIWKKQGYIEVENSRTKQMMRLNVSLLNDIENNSHSLDIISAISK